MTAFSEKEDAFITRFETRFKDAATEFPITFSEALEIFTAYKNLLRRLGRIAKISDSYQSEVKSLLLELSEAAANVKSLKGFIPICASCKKVRDDEGYWKNLEEYISAHSDAMVSHGLCPDCADKYRGLVREGIPSGAAPVPDPSLRLDDTDMDDPVIVRFLPTLNNVHFSTSPLYKDFTLLFHKYVRLARRLKRIARISDIYQFELQDLKTRFENASRLDYLTGLSNRMDMYTWLQVEQSRSIRHGRPFAVIMADVDHFKKINDTCGHSHGDHALVMISATISGNLRKEDVCARWGGEEFLILLPETDREMAMEVAERLRGLIEGLKLDVGGTLMRISASFGVSVCAQCEDVDDCIRRADDALYRAKKDGRNRSVFVGKESS